ncbi:hypothetical protein [Halomonas sp. 328]|uniref:hypothetical protein n=1 Tax=Halomonas sp. 328 TaxID=2776704 RepID=UPI0018A7C1AA|nr:hypothetical protein [Halomonas sp. 328]MBF8222536.1 hypothetical protein [Halomonas sp. 328]
MPTSSLTTAPQSARLADALSDYLAGERALLELRCCAPKRLSALIHDLSRPLPSPLERALARGLNSGELAAWLGPAETLMPPMMRRFGLDPEGLATAPRAAEWRVACRACPHIGTCWQALRHDTDAEACRAFCPNAEAFAEVGRESKR